MPAVPKTGEGTQRLRRHRVPALRVRLEEGRPRDTCGRNGRFQASRREGGRYSGVAGGGVSVEHHRPMGGGRGRDGVLLPVHAPGQSSAALAQGLHSLREFYERFFLSSTYIFRMRNIRANIHARSCHIIYIFLVSCCTCSIRSSRIASIE